jgi:hypothetical protein
MLGRIKISSPIKPFKNKGFIGEFWIDVAWYRIPQYLLDKRFYMTIMALIVLRYGLTGP